VSPSRRPLRSGGGRDCASGPGERVEEGIPLGADIDSAATRERLPQKAAVLAQGLGVALAELEKRFVEPSMSGKRNVTVPLGRSAMGSS
jgi:hypothetical protein